jgi:hypothetical protein
MWGLEGRGDAEGMSATACVISLVVQIGIAIGILWWRVTRQSESSVGASS